MPKFEGQKSKFALKTSANGSAMVNLGCGTVTHNDFNNIDFSPYARLVHYPLLVKLLAKTHVLSQHRVERIRNIDSDILAWDLRKGIPFPDDTFDMVYSSHVLEHIDRIHAVDFLSECFRVTKQGGTIRIVVPDLQMIIKEYSKALNRIGKGDDDAIEQYDRALYELFDQMVRTEPTGTSNQKPLVRTIERLFRKDARQTGEAHRWMYDEYSLGKLLKEVGFSKITRRKETTSQITDWKRFRLDSDENGSPLKPFSLYLEGTRPSR